MSKSRLLLSTLILVPALSMGACNNKSKADATSSGASISQKAFSGSNVTASDIKSLLAVKPRNVEASEAETALAKLGFKNSKSDHISWASKSEKSGTHIYKDVVFKNDDGENITVKTMEIVGPHLQDGDPAFDRVNMSHLRSVGEDWTANIAHLSLSRPSAKTQKSLSQLVENLDELGDMDSLSKKGGKNWDFEAAYMEGLDMKKEDGHIRIDTLGYGQGEGRNKGAMLLDNLSLSTPTQDDDLAVSMSLDHFSMSGINLDEMAMNSDAFKPASFIGGAPGQSLLTNINIKNLKIDSDTASVHLDKMQQHAKENKDVLTVRSSITPSTISFSAPPTTKHFQYLYGILQALDLTTMEFSSDSTSIMDAKTDSITTKDAYISVKDAFDLKYDYEGSGYSAVRRISESDTFSDDETEAVLKEVKINSFNLALTDHNLVDRIINLTAARQNTNPQVIRLQIKVGLGALSAMGGDNPEMAELASSASTSLGNFVDQGGTLKIDIAPQEPLPLSALKDLDPQTFDPAVFGLTISHQK